MTEVALIVDGNNLLVRAIKAMERVPLAAEDTPTGPLLVFVNMLSRYVRQVEPDYLVVCWDGGRSTARLAIYPDYKVARGAHDDTRDPHFVLAKEFLSLCNIHHVGFEGVEADDLVAAYCRVTRGHKVILSGDKDFLQLVAPNVDQLRPTGGDELWTEKRVYDEMGCWPHQIPLVMALCGDPGDGVPGVPKIGRKTACKLLATVDWDLLRLLSDPPKLLVGMHDTVIRNLNLVNLRSPVAGLPTVVHPPKFAPTDLSGILLAELLGFLARYHLTTIKERFLAGSLWKGSDGQVQRLHM